MQTNFNSFQPPYYLQRPNSPKNVLTQNSSGKNISLTLSIGANQSASQLVSMHKFKTVDSSANQTASQPFLEPTVQKLEQQLKVSFKENSFLRQENSQLRRELLKLRRQPTFENSRSLQKFSLSPDFSDLRGTIKKQMGEIKDLRAKVQSLHGQCKMYEQIIEKMQQRIKKLSNQNDKKRGQIEELHIEVSKLDHLKEKTNGIVRLYNDLQGKFNIEQIEWMRWKQNWLAEKECYLQRIRDLEKITQKTYH